MENIEKENVIMSIHNKKHSQTISKLKKTPMQEIIQEILDSDKYTEQDIAKYVGVRQETIHRIGIGKTKKPSHQVSNDIITLYLVLKQETD